MYRFLLSPRWLGWLALVVVLAAACTGLGLWQLDRRNAVAAEISTVTSNYEQQPVSFAEAAGYFRNYDDAGEWLPVTLAGTYDHAGQRIVRNRPLNGRPGYEVLVPLRLDDGNAVVVNRGWLPIGNREAGRPDTIPAAPEGRVTVVVRIRPGENTVNRGAPHGQLASINLPTYQRELGYPVLTGAYGQLAAETPAPATRPFPAPKPSLNEGPHLSYSMQWFVFGLLLFVAYGYAARQQALMDAEAPRDADEAERYYANPAIRRARPVHAQNRRRPSAEDEEDAILDAQGYQTGPQISEAGRGPADQASVTRSR